MKLLTLPLTTVSFIALSVAATAQTGPARPAAPTPSAAMAMIKDVDIPYRKFTLPNGLRVIVHTDRKAPVVSVGIWYDIGSTAEPAGKTGFAHLFEHLMFNGSENAPGEFFAPLKAVGATGYNGTTSFDRTNYFETVPVGALDLALYLESDRMGHLLGAIDQTTLDEQRGVVQNEKRRGDNQPYGMSSYKLFEGLFPAGHPYSHLPIGSMADLDAASLADVKAWFRDNYGPNNAVLVLSGDIDGATARTKVEKYFGAIPRGPERRRVSVTVPTLSAAKTDIMKDQVPQISVTRSWPTPGLKDPDSPALTVAGATLGGLTSARLNTILVKREKLATLASAGAIAFADAGIFSISMMVRPGVDRAKAEAALDRVLKDFLRTGPTAAEIARVVTSRTVSQVKALESATGKAQKLADGELYVNDPTDYKKRLMALASQTPASVKAAADKWLTQPSYTLVVEPGARDAYAEATVPPEVKVAVAPEKRVMGTREAAPPVGAVAPITFPKVEHATLMNGIKISYAQRGAVPFTTVMMAFDSGVAADPVGKSGLQAMTIAMLGEGTTTLDSVRFAEAKEELGLDVLTGGGSDESIVRLTTPSVNLAPALGLMADMVRRPAFAPADLDRVRNQTLTRIDQALSEPGQIGSRAILPLLYGKDYPYSRTISGSLPGIASITRTDLLQYQQSWLRPEKARIYVVSDRPFAEVKAQLDALFGDWRGTGPAGTKSFPPPVTATPRIVLIDRPNSPQSAILGGSLTGLKETDDTLAEQIGNDGLGEDFLSRINMNLREDKHWAYGASGYFRALTEAMPYMVSASVQTDQTGPSLAELRKELTQYVGDKPMTQAEFDRAKQDSIRKLAGSYESAASVLSAMFDNDSAKRGDDYVTTLPARYAALTLDQVRAAMARTIHPSRFVWVVVGDAAKVRPQLDKLGLPIEVMDVANLKAAN